MLNRTVKQALPGKIWLAKKASACSGQKGAIRSFPGVAAHTSIPLTHRDYAQFCILATGLLYL
ncbi:MAG: hypothetical protein H6940_10215 [Burkholderiales bacterium]|nr:hypothetical protein [Burkholderiales bacterium]